MMLLPRHRRSLMAAVTEDADLTAVAEAHLGHPAPLEGVVAAGILREKDPMIERLAAEENPHTTIMGTTAVMTPRHHVADAARAAVPLAAMTLETEEMTMIAVTLQVAAAGVPAYRTKTATLAALRSSSASETEP